jgi:hypothetical protein
LPNTSEKTWSIWILETVRQFLGSIFLPCSKIDQLCKVSRKISELPDIKRRNKTWRHEVVFEYVGNPAGVFCIGLLAANRFDVFGAREDNMTGIVRAH